jgi:triosephosphate isomerase
MARKFFVGGNFKMNPTSVEAKRAIVKILNEADIDSSVGECISPSRLAQSKTEGILQRW